MDDKPHIEITDADLDHLLAQSEREEPILTVTHRAGEPREELDEQILAGLVTPY